MLPFFSLFFKISLPILQASVVQNFLLFLFSVFFILFLFNEERKNVFLVTICSPIRYKILRIFLALFIVFFFYLLHPFIALYVLSFFACFPLLLDQKVQKPGIYFIHFFAYFLYKYFFFFGILFISFLSLFSIPVETIIVNFLAEKVNNFEEDLEFFTLGKGFTKQQLKQIEATKGAQKIDLIKEKQVEATARLGEIIKSTLNKSFHSLDEEMVRRKMSHEQQLFVRDLTVKFGVNLVDTFRNKVPYPPYDIKTYFDNHPKIFPETKDVIKAADLHAKMMPFVSESLLYFDIFKYFNYYNELIITPALLKHYEQNNLYPTICAARILDAIIHEAPSIPAGKVLEEIYEKDAIPSHKTETTEGLIVIKKKAPYFKFSLGQDLRFYVGFGDNIARPTDGKTHDLNIKIGDKIYAIENKLLVTKFVKPDHEKNLKLCLEKDIIQEEHVAVIFDPDSKSMQVLKKEATPSFDLTQQYFLFKEKVDGNFDEFVNVLVTKSTTLRTYISQGKPIIFYSKSSIDDPLLIKTYNCKHLNLENNKTIIKK